MPEGYLEAPDFKLQLANGGDLVLSETWREHSVLLWFSRGLVCPFCRRQMVQLARVYDDLLSQDVVVVQITATTLETARKMLEYFEVRWPYACDPEGSVAAAYDMAPGGIVGRIGAGVLEQARAWSIIARSPGEPHPEVLGVVKESEPPPARDGGMVLVDRGGRVRFKQPSGKLSLLPSTGNLLRIVRETLGKAA